MVQKKLTELRAHHTILMEKVEILKQLFALLSYWGIKHDITETVDILNNLLTTSDSLLKHNKIQYVQIFLDSATDISDEIEKHHIENHQDHLFTSTQTLFRKAEKIASTSKSDLLKNIQNILDKKEKPTELSESIGFYTQAINLINQLIKNRQASFKKVINQLDDQEARSKIEDALNSPENHNSICKSIKTSSIPRLINSVIQKNDNNLMLAVFGDKQFIEKFFTQIHGKPVSFKIDGEQETTILWRLTLSRNTVIYILGLTTDKLLKHSEQKWFERLGDFNSVLISLENLEPLSDQYSIALMTILNLAHNDVIHLIEPASDPLKSYKQQHFLFQHLKHVYFGVQNNEQKISNWIIQSIFPYNGEK